MTDTTDINPRWGFWVPVIDRASAEYATKMSGLPVFLLGFSFIAQALFFFSFKNYMISSTLVVAGVFFIFSGLMIRKCRIGTLPISVCLWIILNILNAYVVYVIAGFTTQIGASMVIIAIVGLLAISGLRGWWWLRTHKE